MSDHRLSRAFLPSHYLIDLDASPKRKSFTGLVHIKGKLTQKSSSIELHSRDLKIAEAKLTKGQKKLKAKIQPKPEQETVLLVFAEEITGPVALELTFRGKLNPSMHGLYAAKDGSHKALVSQCEAADARSIFPCCDEPEFKAKFEWVIRTDLDLVVITNGVKKSQRKSKGRVVHRFAPTRVISSYLVAVTIGPFAANKTRRINGIPCTVWAAPGKENLGEFAQDVTAYCLPFYRNYFGQKYNYQKLDQVAVPGFDAGAMENVGAIFYRQNLLLMAPEVTTWRGQKRIAEVIAHELSHQWFGNLVTMKWWDDLWLNEAFATWIAYKAVDTWQPSWRMWDDYLEGKEGALAADSLENTHPVYADVKTPGEATELFDLITYEKGCAIVRMTEGYLGEDVFRAGIRRYMETHKNGNAAGADLWNALQQESGEPVGDIMRSWIEQSGFPLLTVRLSHEGGAAKLRVVQQRYFASAQGMKDGSSQAWNVPMVVQYEDDTGLHTKRLLLKERSETFDFPASTKWVSPNHDALGFYRVEFGESELKSLLDHGLSKLSPGVRVSLLEDQWSLVRTGLSDIAQFMRVVSAFHEDRDYVVVRTLASRLHAIANDVVRDRDSEALKDFVRWFFAPHLDELGSAPIPGEPNTDAVRRAAALEALGIVGDELRAISVAQMIVDEEMKNPKTVDANLAGAAIRVAAHHGDPQLLERFVKTYTARNRARSAPDLQLRYLSGLASFTAEKVVKKVLTMCVDDTIPQDQLRTILTPLLGRRETQRWAWSFLKKHWDTISVRVGSMGISRLIESTGALPFELRPDIISFFKGHPVEEAHRAVNKAVESMDLRQQLVDREAATLGQWLTQRAKAA